VVAGVAARGRPGTGGAGPTGERRRVAGRGAATRGRPGAAAGGKAARAGARNTERNREEGSGTVLNF
jgi:hypothetical protein